MLGVNVNLLIGWQFDLYLLLPALLLGVLIAAVCHRPLHTPEPVFTTPYDWAEQGVF